MHGALGIALLSLFAATSWALPIAEGLENLEWPADDGQIDVPSESLQKRAAAFSDVDSVCSFFHRKCLTSQNSNENCEEPHKECLTYGKMFVRGSFKYCMYMLEDSTECELRQLQVINKLARDIHRGRLPLLRSPSRRASARSASTNN